MKKPKRLDLLGIDAGRPLSGPETIHVDITNGCNTNCITCWDHSPLLLRPRSSAWKRRRAEVADVVALLDDAMGMGALRAVILSGMGDPMTHPDVYAMIEAIKARGLHLTIITNLVPADPARLLALDVDQLLIGVHAASEAAYLAFHPNFSPREWAKLGAALEVFAAAGRRYKHVQVVARVNAHELPAMIRFAARYRAGQVNFKLASLGEGTEACRITEAQREELLSDLVPEARRQAERLAVASNLDVFEAQLRAGGAATAPIAEVGCFMGYVYARVLVDGTVLFCCNTEVVVGHLDEAPLSALWEGERWNAFRDRMRAGDYLPSCAQCGKLNQNVALGRRFAEAFGEARLAEVTGRGGARGGEA